MSIGIPPPRLALHLYDLYRAAPKGIAFGDLDKGFIQYANPYFLNQTGYTEEFLRKNRFWDLIHEDDRDDTAAYVDENYHADPSTPFVFTRYMNRYDAPKGVKLLTWTGTDLKGRFLAFVDIEDEPGEETHDIGSIQT